MTSSPDLSLSSTIPVGYQEHPHHYGSKPNAFEHGTNGPKRSEESSNPPPSSTSSDKLSIWYNVIAGGLGGVVADSAMHPLDTVKTKQQAPTLTSRSTAQRASFKSTFQQEGVRKGLYAGYSAAVLGSLPSTAVFFGTYEYIKTTLIDQKQHNETLVYLLAGFSGDLVSSVIYVPSEVLKTRLQLQGKLNVGLFGYKSLRDAIHKIYKTEGLAAFFYGYKATLSRDLPFSALQFAFYEKFRQYALQVQKNNNGCFDQDGHKHTHSAFVGEDEELNLVSELLTGASAGGLAGIITTPLDVMKTRIQTDNSRSGDKSNFSPNSQTQTQSHQILRGIRTVYQKEGLLGLFSGVGPRFVWTSIQSSIMLYLYQSALKAMNFESEVNKVKNKKNSY
ncbi:hypothetical protein ACO0QE_001273 [Hanseniaspora vineae]